MRINLVITKAFGEKRYVLYCMIPKSRQMGESKNTSDPYSSQTFLIKLCNGNDSRGSDVSLFLTNSIHRVNVPSFTYTCVRVAQW